MKLIPVAILTALTVAAAAVIQGGRPVTQTREAAYAEMLRFAEERLHLQRIECGDLPIISPDTPCYVTDLRPQQVQAALADRPELTMLTGWRDDYGMLSAGFHWKKGAWEMGVAYARASARDFDDRPDIQAHKGQVTVVIDAH